MFHYFKKNISPLLNFSKVSLTIRKKYYTLTSLLLTLMLLQSNPYIQAGKSEQPKAQTKKAKTKSTTKKIKKANEKGKSKSKDFSNRAKMKGGRDNYLDNPRKLKSSKKNDKNSNKKAKTKVKRRPTYALASTYLKNNQEIYEAGLTTYKTRMEGYTNSFIKIFIEAYSDIWKKKMEKDLDLYMPILIDPQTTESLSIFSGKKGSESENLVNKVADILRPQSQTNYIVRFFVFLDLLGAHTEQKNLQYKIKQLNTLKEKPQVAYKLFDLLTEYESSFSETASFLAVPKIDLYFQKDLDRYLINSINNILKSDLLSDLEKSLGSPFSNLAKKNPYISFYTRIGLIAMGYVELLSWFDNVKFEFKKWLNIVRHPKTSFLYQFKYHDISGYDRRYQPTPVGDTALFGILDLVYDFL